MLTRDYPPAVGGIATHTHALVSHLRSIGVDIDVFVGVTDSKTILLSIDKDFKEYDLVHVQSSPYGALIRKLPLVVTVHAPVLTEWRHYTLNLKAKSIPAYWCEKLALRKATIVAVSEQTRHDLRRLYGVDDQKITVIPGGVDYGRFARPRRHEIDLPVRILLLSRLEPRKNVMEAIQALSAFPRESYVAKIVGDGSERKSLQRVATDLQVNAEFLGKVSDEILPDVYSDADIFISSSRSEGFGLTILEAMASGCAVIASDIPTHRDLLRDEIDGLLYDNLEGLIEKLRVLISSPTLAKSLGEEARQHAKDFSWIDVARRTYSVYQRCLTS